LKEYLQILTILESSSKVSGVMSSLQPGRVAWFKLNRPRKAVKTTKDNIVELQKVTLHPLGNKCFK